MYRLISPFIDEGEALTSTLTDLTLRGKETSIAMLLNSTAGKFDAHVQRRICFY